MQKLPYIDFPHCHVLVIYVNIQFLQRRPIKAIHCLLSVGYSAWGLFSEPCVYQLLYVVLLACVCTVDLSLTFITLYCHPISNRSNRMQRFILEVREGFTTPEFHC